MRYSSHQSLTKDDLKAIEEFISDAERRTGAELVCAISTESGRYDRAEGIVGICFSLLFLCIAELVASSRATDTQWDPSHAPFAWQCTAVLVGWLIGNLLASHVHCVRRFFCSRREMHEEARHAASRVFLSCGLCASPDTSAVLLYFSMFEQSFVVLANESAGGAALARDVRDIATKELRSGRHREAIISAITPIADRLAKDVPSNHHNLDVHPNRVLLFHPRPI